MPLKTISKNTIFVIFALPLLVLAGIACSIVSRGLTRPESEDPVEPSAEFEAPVTIGRLSSPAITESSGVAASRCNRGVLWTHNDSGSGPLIYAFDKTGAHLGVWNVRGAQSIDWEDIAAVKNGSGECRLFIGDIGRGSSKRTLSHIYIVREPVVGAGGKRRRSTEQALTVRFRFPGKAEDAEALLVHPGTLDIYVLSKSFTGPSIVFRIARSRYEAKKPGVIEAEKVGSVILPAVPNGFVTAGDISSDGRRVILADYFNGYELVLPRGETDFDRIWSEELQTIDIGFREQGEAICYSPDAMSLFATSEKRNSPLIEVKRKR